MAGRAIMAVLLLANAAVAEAGFGTDPKADPFDVVRRGLVEEMRLSGESLDAQRRLEATRALDRALHLAEFAMSARGLPGAVDEPFHAAHNAIMKARHSLQIGRPSLAAIRLACASDRLAEAPLPDVGSRGIDPDGDLEGVTVLNARGHVLGEIDGYGVDTAGEPVALVGHGGFIWFGETVVPVPTDLLLGAKSFVVLPSAISPEEFAAAPLS